MSWIILEVASDSDGVSDVNIMTNEHCEMAMFQSGEEADEWLENHHDAGYSYHTVEVW